jgi:hypothetical protein
MENFIRYEYLNNEFGELFIAAFDQTGLLVEASRGQIDGALSVAVPKGVILLCATRHKNPESSSIRFVRSATECGLRDGMIGRLYDLVNLPDLEKIRKNLDVDTLTWKALKMIALHDASQAERCRWAELESKMFLIAKK